MKAKANCNNPNKQADNKIGLFFFSTMDFNFLFKGCLNFHQYKDK
nr:MAG TPA: hypothetical protein [Caudoviricetes sp.]